MKYYIGSECDYLSVYKEEDNKFYRAVGWSDNSYSFEEIPYIPKNVVAIESIPSKKLNEPFKDKKSYHKLMKTTLEKMKLTDYKLRTELDLHNRIIFVIISDSLAKDRFDNLEKIIDNFEKDHSQDIYSFAQIQLVSNETWNSRKY